MDSSPTDEGMSDNIKYIKSAHGHQLDRIYQLAQTFYSEKSDKAFNLDFDERITFSALVYHIKYGKFDEGKSESPGFFDFIGKRRIAEWKALGEMKQDDAKWEFITRLHKLCPLFLPYLDAYFRHMSNQKSSVPLDSIDPARFTNQTTVPSSMEEVTAFIQQNEADIRAALNTQTHQQFEQYAMQHYPLDLSKRQALIMELQQRHFHEYVAYIRQRYALTQHDHPQMPSDPPPNITPSNVLPLSRDSPGRAVQHKETDAVPSSCMPSKPTAPHPQSTGAIESATSSSALGISHLTSTSSSTNASECSNPNGFVMIPSQNEIPAPVKLETSDKSFAKLSPTEASSDPDNLVHTPSMWTRDEVKEFRENLSGSKESVVQVGCGEVITIRVPAYPSGTSIMWEFSTDDYDIGFGLYFEWESDDDTPSDQPEVSVEDASKVESPAIKEPLVDEIIPIFRRNSHQEVYCGAHEYPGCGTYLFKFDNSYSLWRSKTLYYRVYYTC